MPSTVDLESYCQIAEQADKLRAQGLTTHQIRNHIRKDQLFVPHYVIDGAMALKGMIIQAHERDRIQEGRPDGCWCLGLGGQGNFYLRYAKQHIVGAYCDCPEGKKVREEADKLITKDNEKWWHESRSLIWNNAGVPLRFKNMRLDTSPLTKSHPSLIHKLRCPNTIYLDQNEEGHFTILAGYRSCTDGFFGSWYFWGSHGTGKTGLAVSYIWERVKLCEHHAVIFRTLPKLLGELRNTYNSDESEESIIREFVNASCLVIDDIGAEQVSDSGWVQDRLFRIIGDRHAGLKDTVFTSNLSLEKLSLRIGERIVWRIVEMCGANHIVKIDGANLRDKGAK